MLMRIFLCELHFYGGEQSLCNVFSHFVEIIETVLFLTAKQTTGKHAR